MRNRSIVCGSVWTQKRDCHSQLVVLDLFGSAENFYSRRVTYNKPQLEDFFLKEIGFCPSHQHLNHFPELLLGGSNYLLRHQEEETSLKLDLELEWNTYLAEV
jgi:hypothetical protein